MPPSTSPSLVRINKPAQKRAQKTFAFNKWLLRDRWFVYLKAYEVDGLKMEIAVEHA